MEDQVLNAAILTSAWSAASSDLFSSSRGICGPLLFIFCQVVHDIVRWSRRQWECAKHILEDHTPRTTLGCGTSCVIVHTHRVHGGLPERRHCLRLVCKPLRHRWADVVVRHLHHVSAVLQRAPGTRHRQENTAVLVHISAFRSVVYPDFLRCHCSSEYLRFCRPLFVV